MSDKRKPFPSSPLLEALRPSPLSLNMILLVNPREEILLQMPERPSRNRLIVVPAQQTIESLFGLAAVLELGEHHFAVFGQKWAGCVAVVGSF